MGKEPRVLAHLSVARCLASTSGAMSPTRPSTATSTARIGWGCVDRPAPLRPTCGPGQSRQRQRRSEQSSSPATRRAHQIVAAAGAAASTRSWASSPRCGALASSSSYSASRQAARSRVSHVGAFEQPPAAMITAVVEAAQRGPRTPGRSQPGRRTGPPRTRPGGSIPRRPPGTPHAGDRETDQHDGAPRAARVLASGSLTRTVSTFS